MTREEKSRRQFCKVLWFPNGPCTCYRFLSVLTDERVCGCPCHQVGK